MTVTGVQVDDGGGGGGVSAGRRYAATGRRRKAVFALHGEQQQQQQQRPAALAPSTDRVAQAAASSAAGKVRVVAAKTVDPAAALDGRKGLDLLATPTGACGRPPAAGAGAVGGSGMAGSHRHGIYQRVAD